MKNTTGNTITKLPIAVEKITRIAKLIMLSLTKIRAVPKMRFIRGIVIITGLAENFRKI